MTSQQQEHPEGPSNSWGGRDPDQGGQAGAWALKPASPNGKAAPAPPKAKTKATALKAKEAVREGACSHMRAHTHTSSTFWRPNTLVLLRQPKYRQKSAPWKHKPDHYVIIKFPLTVSAMKKLEDSNIPMFIVDVRANKHQIELAEKKLYDTDVAKVNILIRTEGEKAYLQLAPGYDALDAANKIGII
ncbi:60S ribosomal protein L23a-like [Pteronotus mesoamericanus]|uniref:60S ribosomal protein L23a-like n=1 Tax=Pteronotus mesoamericanus TaxID=1884717 RepID=UPI0023ED712F|nr:60S ribosomal protein L23a-like [Pteronotus parnellii mesoamericanus]